MDGRYPTGILTESRHALLTKDTTGMTFVSNFEKLKFGLFCELVLKAVRTVALAY